MQIYGRISIHAPREGGDRRSTERGIQSYYFNPRPPRGGRLSGNLAALTNFHFNPRPPRGGATTAKTLRSWRRWRRSGRKHLTQRNNVL